jgi:hypothetical protein
MEGVAAPTLTPEEMTAPFSDFAPCRSAYPRIECLPSGMTIAALR